MRTCVTCLHPHAGLHATRTSRGCRSRRQTGGNVLLASPCGIQRQTRRQNGESCLTHPHEGRTLLKRRSREGTQPPTRTIRNIVRLQTQPGGYYSRYPSSISSVTAGRERQGSNKVLLVSRDTGRRREL